MLNSNIDNLFSLDNKVAIVTGASRGTGRAIAEGFINAGALVYFIARSKNKLSIVKDEIQNDRAKFISADVTDFPLMSDNVEKIYGKENKIDILVNNAAITLPEPSDTYSDDKWQKTHMVNLRAPFKLSQMVAKYMRKQGGGVIINITSICSELGFSDNPAYVAFKGGLKQLTKALAKDWGEHNIRVNNLGLGYFKTEMTKGSWEDEKLREERTKRTILGRWGEAEDIVGPAIFLASNASKYITGQDLYVDGGWLASGI